MRGFGWRWWDPDRDLGICSAAVGLLALPGAASGRGALIGMYANFGISDYRATVASYFFRQFRSVPSAQRDPSSSAARPASGKVRCALVQGELTGYKVRFLRKLC